MTLLKVCRLYQPLHEDSLRSSNERLVTSLPFYVTFDILPLFVFVDLNFIAFGNWLTSTVTAHLQLEVDG